MTSSFVVPWALSVGSLASWGLTSNILSDLPKLLQFSPVFAAACAMQARGQKSYVYSTLPVYDSNAGWWSIDHGQYGFEKTWSPFPGLNESMAAYTIYITMWWTSQTIEGSGTKIAFSALKLNQASAPPGMVIAGTWDEQATVLVANFQEALRFKKGWAVNTDYQGMMQVVRPEGVWKN